MQALKLDRVSETPTLYRTTENGPLLNRKVYSYNGTNGLYDVCVDSTLGVWYRTNCRKSEKNKWHEAIEAHFKIPTNSTKG